MELVSENLAAKRGENIIFSDLNFTLSAGHALTISGPNGIGKSTLLRIIAGLLAPFQGSVRFHDGVQEARPQPYCHYLGPANAMKPRLTVYDNLQFWSDFQGASTISIHEALDQMGLGPVAFLSYNTLSTGQKRRVGIARLLLNRRIIWLLDEPNAGLDTQAHNILTKLINSHLDSGGMAIAALHQPLNIDNNKSITLADFCNNHSYDHDEYWEIG